MSNENSVALNRAAEYWRSGQAIQAGRLIFENLAIKARPKWASSILESVVRRSGIRFAPIESILHIANHPAEWNQAHTAFSTLRKSTLELERLHARSPEQKILLAQLGLAENVAKVIYNATNPPDPFDEDSGWWVAPCLKSILDLLGDNEFSEVMWSALCYEAK